MLDPISPSAASIIALRDHPALLEQAAVWFHTKWGISVEAYRESMDTCVTQPASVPQWYIMLDTDGKIIAGAGVIENDFHDRKDLAPNLCALFVEEPWRKRGIAPRLLEFAHSDIASLGRPDLYLVTDHIGLYERYGWEFVSLAIDDDSGETMRIYRA